MKKYKFPALNNILKVKVGTKYVWEERVRQQANLVHVLEDVYDIKLNFRAFSFYPNYLYFGGPISNNPNLTESKKLWCKVKRVFTDNRWKVYAAYENVNPKKAIPKRYDNFEDLGFGHVQLLLSELVLMDLNCPSHGVGQQVELSLFQPLIGFSKGSVSRMIRGSPGSLILEYTKDEELLKMLSEISKRKSYRAEPFYVKKHSSRVLKSVYKGKQCLNAKYRDCEQ